MRPLRNRETGAFSTPCYKDRPQNGHKIEQGNEEDAQADLVDPFMAKISPLPVGRFDEMPKAFERAPSGVDLIIDRPGLSDRARRRYGDGNGCEGFHGLDSFESLIGTVPDILDIY
jgi:hypothetical protein